MFYRFITLTFNLEAKTRTSFQQMVCFPVNLQKAQPLDFEIIELFALAVNYINMHKYLEVFLQYIHKTSFKCQGTHKFF